MAPPTGDAIRTIALRTLSRDILDEAPISAAYIEALTHFLSFNPKERNFLVDLTIPGGCITCMDCWDDIQLGTPGIPYDAGDFAGFGNWEQHVKSKDHLRASSGRREEMSSSPELSRLRLDSSPLVPLRELVSASSSSVPKKKKKEYRFPDGEVIMISSEEEDVKPSIFAQPRGIMQASHGRPIAGSSRAFAASAIKHEPAIKAEPIEESTSTLLAAAHIPTISSVKAGKRRAIASFSPTGGRIVGPHKRVKPEPGTTSSPFLAAYTTVKSEPNPLSGAFGVKPEPGVRVKPEPGAKPEPMLPGAFPQDQLKDLDLPAAMRSWPESVKNLYREEQYRKGAVNPAGMSASTATSTPGASGSRMVNALGMEIDPPPLNGQNNLLNNMYERELADGWGDPADEHIPVLSRTDPTQIREFIMTALEDFENMPSIREAAKGLGLKNPEDRIPGMDVSLMAHQLLGVLWMEKQEQGKVKGGILADDMGLGKTVQTIAIMVKNPPKTKDRRTTLIIAPLALLEQWKSEIELKTQDGLLRVCIHHGSTRLTTKKQIAKFDVVITTLGTLAREFPASEEEKRKKRKKKQKARGDDFVVDDDDSDEEHEDKKPLGALALNKWHRVVIDEAHLIRTRQTHKSKCVAELDSQYRWCLTGTPVYNYLRDLYGLIRFVGYRPWNDWAEFNERINRVQPRNPGLAGKRAQAMLKPVLLRRTKTTMLDGKPLLTLPPKNIEVVNLEFTADERKIYNAIEARERMKASKYFKAGTVMKHYHVILVMLLRLRQACNHPQLLTSKGAHPEDGVVVEEGSDDEDHAAPTVETLEDVVKRAMKEVGEKFVNSVQDKLRDRAKLRIQDAERDEDDQCPICFDDYGVDCLVTPCGHMFCADCIHDVLKSGLGAQDVADEVEEVAGRRPCPVCRQNIEKSRLYKTAAFEPSEAELEKMQKAADRDLIVDGDDGDEDEDATDDEDADADAKLDVFKVLTGSENDKKLVAEANLDSLDQGDYFDPSVKMIKLTSLIQKWREEDPLSKIIVYSQWTTYLGMLETLLHREAVSCLRYDGAMSRKNRDATLVDFKKPGIPQVILISLKCGGVGLNLVEASRVICLDLAWNSATELQAIDRCHRIGQTQPVQVQRLIVENTIEQRILTLQERKQELSDAALGEGKVGKNPRMGVKDLAMLFGFTNY